MANTQVKFHSVTQEAYAGITSPSDGSLYFISDNGEIRKGDKHITGTRVFLATDTVKGCSKVEDLTITIDGKAITETGAEQPKRGDMLRVKHVLVSHTEGEGEDATVVEDAVEYSAYIYGGNGGTYDVANWQACDGNVDASKVILTQNITMAGNYTSIGNFSKTSAAGKNSTFMDGGTGTAGASVYELIKQMLSKTIEPTWKRNPPTASISASAVDEVEQGTTVSTTFTASFNDAYANFTNGNYQYAGCTVDTSTGKGYHIDGAETGSSTKTVTKSWVAGVETPPSATVTIDYNASTKTMKNNLGDDATISPSSISAGTTAQATATASVTTYRNTYWSYASHNNLLGWTEAAGFPVADVSTIRQYFQKNKTELPTTLDISTGTFQYIFILGRTDLYGTKKLTADTDKGLPYIDSADSPLAEAKGTIDIPDASGGNAISYTWWLIDAGSDVNGDIVHLTWH